MKHFAILLILFFFSLQSFSQAGGSSTFSDLKTKVQIDNLSSRKNNELLKENQISGSPYLNRVFTKGLIVRTDSSKIDNLALRYNIFSNRMEFKQKSTVLYIPDAYNIERILLGNKTFVYARYMTSKETKASWFQLLKGGRYQLLKRYRVVLLNEDFAPNRTDSHRFEPAPPEYFFRYRNGMAHQIKSTQKLIKYLQPIPQKIIDYIEAQKFIAHDESRLINILIYTEKVTE